jgi:hypothetical protein
MISIYIYYVVSESSIKSIVLQFFRQRINIKNENYVNKKSIENLMVSKKLALLISMIIIFVSAILMLNTLSNLTR